MDDRGTIQVLIRNGEGKYLAGHQGDWSFTEQREQARIFDYVADHIPEQLELLQRYRNLDLSVIPIDPRERYEICDHCGKRVMSFRAFFDGHEYLCPDCRPSATA